MANSPSVTETTRGETTFLGHPIGLYVLFFTEMWERFSYYGMRALLVLYMTSYFRWTQEHSSMIYKWYTTLVYVTPILGGYMADRYLGNRLAVFIGAILMAIGHFLMAFEATQIFYSALVFLIVGNGFFKPNMTTQVGQLYPPNDRRRDGAYTIFYMGINMGAFLSPIACGWLQENTKGGFHAGFALAGIGMVLGLLTYFFGQPFLVEYQADPNKAALPGDIMSEKEAENHPSVLGKFQGLIPMVMWLGALGLLGLGCSSIVQHWGNVNAAIKGAAPSIVSGISLCAIAWITSSVKNAVLDRVATIVVVGLFAIFFWAAFEQQGNALNIWADKVTNRYLTQDPKPPGVHPEPAQIFSDVDAPEAQGFWESIMKSLGRFGEIFQLKEGREADGGNWFNPVPTAYFQSINAFCIFVMAPIFAWVWLRIELSIPAKMVIGLLFMGLSFLVMVWGAVNENEKHQLTVKGSVPASIHLDSEGRIILGEKNDEHAGRAHAGRLKIHEGKVEWLGVFSDLERDELSILTTPESFKSAVKEAAKALDEQKAKKQPRFYQLTLPADVKGFELAYGGFHRDGIQFDRAKNQLTIKQVIPDKDQKALSVCAADPDFRGTLDAVMVDSSSSRVSSHWLLWCYILGTMGELCLSPVGQSMTSKLSPKRFATMLMGVWLLVTAFGNFAAGAMGEIAGSTPPISFFGYMTMALFAAAGVLILLVPKLTRMMHGVK